VRRVDDQRFVVNLIIPNGSRVVKVIDLMKWY